MARKIWPWIAALTGIGIATGIGVALLGEEDRNLYRYMTDEEYEEAVTLPEDARIVVVAHSPEAMQAPNVTKAVEQAAASNPEIYFVVVSKEIGTSRLGMDIDPGWGGVAAGEPGNAESVYAVAWGPQTSKADIQEDIAAALNAVRGGGGESKLPTDDAAEVETQTATVSVQE